MEEYLENVWSFVIMSHIDELCDLDDIDTLNRIMSLLYKERKQIPIRFPQSKGTWLRFNFAGKENGNYLILDNKREAEAHKEAQEHVKKFLGSGDVLYGYMGRKCLWLPNNESDSKINQYWFTVANQDYPEHLPCYKTLACMPEKADKYLLIPYHTSESGERIYVDYFEDCLKYSCKDCSKEGKPQCVVSKYELRFEEDPDGFMFAILSSSMFKTYCNIWAGAKKYLNEGMWNTFPMPLIDESQKEIIIECGQKVREERNKIRRDFPYYSLYELCDPDKPNRRTALKKLIEAYQALDSVVDAVFSLGSLGTEIERQEMLLARLNPVRKEILGILNQKMQEQASHWGIEAICWRDKVRWVEESR